MIGIIDYGMGNLRSVLNAFEAINVPTRLVRQVEELADLQGYVLPGVGAFGDGMENLRRSGLVPPLTDLVMEKKRPILGICLGMQLLLTEGTEGVEDIQQSPYQGLGWIPGRVLRMESASDPAIRIPHVGWNDVTFSLSSPVFEGLPDPSTFYFVHSFVALPEDPKVISGRTTHGHEFAAALHCGNLYAVQFHPEKSHRAGLQVLSNWWKAVQSW